MKKTLGMVVLMIAAVGVVGCSDSAKKEIKDQPGTTEEKVGARGVVDSSDSYEKIVEDALPVREEMIEALKGVTDVKTAEASWSKFEALFEKEEAFEVRMAKLGELSEEECKPVVEKYSRQLKRLEGKLARQVARLQAKPEGMTILKIIENANPYGTMGWSAKGLEGSACRANQTAIAIASTMYQRKEGRQPTTLADLTTPSANNRDKPYLPSTPVCLKKGTYSVPTGACTVNHTN